MPAIAIIGGGAVGVGVLRNILDQLSATQQRASGTIRIFDNRKRIGPGLPYAEDKTTNLLNRPAPSMSLSNENPAEFYQWIRANWMRFNRPDCDMPSSGDFLPRSYFGRYLEDQWHQARQKGKALGLDIDSVHSRVSDIIPQQNGGFQLKCTDGQKSYADIVVLATGNQRAGKFAHLSEQSSSFIRSPYPTATLVDQIPNGVRVGIIGTRLSAIDAVLALAHSGFKGPITMSSRSGELPSIRAPQIPHHLSAGIQAFAKQCLRSKKPIPLAEVMDRLLAEITIAERKELSLEDITRPDLDRLQRFRQDYYQSLTGIRPWQAVLVALNPIIPILWNALSHDEKKLFHKNHYSRFLTHRVGIPPRSAGAILDLIDQQRLSVLSGMTGAIADDRDVALLIDGERHECNVIIDASGPWPDLSDDQDTLFAGLRKRGEIRSHEFGGLDVDFHTNQVRYADGKLHENMYAIGNLTVGVHLFTSVLEQNLIHAQSVAQRVSARLFSGDVPLFDKQVA